MIFGINCPKLRGVIKPRAVYSRYDLTLLNNLTNRSVKIPAVVRRVIDYSDTVTRSGGA